MTSLISYNNTEGKLESPIYGQSHL